MPTVKKHPPAPEEDVDFIKIVYKELSENARYYDGHIWQIPSVTIAVNAFLINQAFSDNVQDFPLIRILMVSSAAVFTFVLLVALVKHRLHKSAQDRNIERIEKHLKLREELHFRYNFSKKEHLEEVEGKKQAKILQVLAPVGANKGLMCVMVVIFFVDIAILLGILFRYW
jgi:hypothetical protein